MVSKYYMLISKAVNLDIYYTCYNTSYQGEPVDVLPSQTISTSVTFLQTYRIGERENAPITIQRWGIYIFTDRKKQ